MQEDWKKRSDRVSANTYQRFPLVLTRGTGCRLYDDQNREFLDFVAGIAVCNLGHAHPRLIEVLGRQAAELWHVSNLYYTLPQTELAEWLTRNSFADRVFFCNSGAEANEAAIKLARRYFKERGEPERYRIIAMEQSFHGRTMATLSATGQEKIRRGYDPVLEGFAFVPFDDLQGLKDSIDSRTCAVLLEPVQGEGGVNCPRPEYLQEVRRICDDAGLLLILDEIQTGLGRTGTLFAHEQYGTTPDIMTLAKALANGLPIGAMLARESVARGFTPGAHASTFGGTPLVTAVALAVCRELTEGGVIQRAKDTAAYFKSRLNWLQQRHDVIEDIRGMGLLLGMKIGIDGDAVVKACMERGFLINCIQHRILRFVPPLIIGREEIDALIECLDDVLRHPAHTSAAES